jgi:hypothetical protein
LRSLKKRVGLKAAGLAGIAEGHSALAKPLD